MVARKCAEVLRTQQEDERPSWMVIHFELDGAESLFFKVSD
jgi:hypothetical protein